MGNRSLADLIQEKDQSNTRGSAANKSQRRRQRKIEKSQKKTEKFRPEPYNPRPLEPRNAAQAHLLDSLYDGYDQVLALGPAGTGKTFLPAAVAADWLMAGDVDRIVVTRPAVCADEDHGYLPGGIDSKFEPYIAPILDALKARMGTARVAQCRREGMIEFIPLAYMRGRTFSNAFVLLDEAQNTTPAQMKMFLTRIGDDSVVCINGDPAQSDLDPADENGLSLLMHVAQSQSLPVEIVTFGSQDVVRSEICALWADAFERAGKSHEFGNRHGWL